MADIKPHLNHDNQRAYQSGFKPQRPETLVGKWWRAVSCGNPGTAGLALFRVEPILVLLSGWPQMVELVKKETNSKTEATKWGGTPIRPFAVGAPWKKGATSCPVRRENRK